MGHFSAWPVTAQTTAELPPPLDVQLTEQLARGESIQQLVYVPADRAARRRGWWERTRGVQVLALTDRRVIIGVQAVRAGESPWVALPYDHMLTWNIEHVLLYGRLEICGDDDGSIARTFIEFNTVGLRQIEAALIPLEVRTLGINRHSVAGPVRAVPGVADLPFKFSNSLSHTLLPREQLRGLVFQDPATEPLFWSGAD